MKIVVTGALGHIGSKVIRDIPNFVSSVEIWMIDNLLTQRYSSLFDLPKTNKYKFVESNIIDCDLSEAFRDADVVLHLAAITNAAGSFHNKEEVNNNNYLATQRVAEECIKTNVPMIFISSTSVYGTQKKIVDENCSLDELNPQSPYAETKLQEESLLHAFGEKNNLNYIICRFGTIFGVSVGMRFHTAINKFCWQAVMGKPITVWRTAINQMRPYLDLSDAVSAIATIVNNKIYDREVYNVLTTNATVKEIIDIISIDINKTEIEYVDSEIMNQLSYTVSNQKFKNTGFKYSGSLEDRIHETIELLRSSNELQ